ncbi:lactonase family protein [Phragmitibacter flavus]|uniref:Lactonase family protein n=1 Tax=Phragmitibacter flavus TaxID=2576071 RepID=A0A5R8KID9_9BACT|nr:lactonase family protein [Phragmitibacter flavus]TLD72083.1 lactonase family protein [Phragmitibacter flavus]
MKRRIFFTVVALVATLSVSWTQTSEAHDQLVYVGTYTGGKSPSKGIYVYGLDSTSGKLTPMGVAAEANKPSFLALHPSKKFLYAVAEGDGKQGGLSSYSIDPSSGKLTLLNQQSSQGSGPCHVSVDATGKVLFVANYGSGHVASLAIKEDGSIGDAITAIQQGPPSNVNAKGRQKGPHAHSFYPSPDNRYALSCDLGCDRVFVYQLDPATGALTANEAGSANVPPGGGPRHFAFHPNGKFGYACNELTMAVTSFSYDADAGALKALETISTLPEGTAIEGFSTAETVAHPSGKFVYVSNRGHNSLATFTVDEVTGKLTFVEAAPSVVAIPRNFNVDPSGKWLIAAGQQSNDIVVFAIDQTTGKLTPTGERHEVGAPVCIKFLSLK